ncbi:MAG: uL15 family ribosomal protein [Patescibacteria group bacterium]
MQLHQLKPIHKNKKLKRVGRGGVHGFSCGRGNKGQRSRPSSNFKPVIRELIKKYPKLRGYRSKSFLPKAAVLDLGILDKKFDTGEKVFPQILIEKRLVRRMGGKIPKIKILGGGEIKKALVFEGCLISNSAKEKIKKAGGEIKQNEVV